jgi:hypothetical protein
VTLTLEKIVLPTGILLPEPNAPICPGIFKMPAEPHFAHLPVVFMIGYSITSSARASTVSGTVIPSALGSLRHHNSLAKISQGLAAARNLNCLR